MFRWALFLLLPVLVNVAGCSGTSDEESCTPHDQDGVVGGRITVLLAVSDTTFAVGGVDSGSTQRNITLQNSSEVTLTLTNVGMSPHSFVLACIASELPAECPQTSCFPAEANIAPVEPGQSTTVMFSAPAVEGAYPFSSNVPGDDALIGQFVLN